MQVAQVVGARAKNDWHTLTHTAASGVGVLWSRGDKPSDMYFLLLLSKNEILPIYNEPEKLIRFQLFNQRSVDLKHMTSTLTAPMNEGPFPYYRSYFSEIAWKSIKQIQSIFLFKTMPLTIDCFYGPFVHQYIVITTLIHATLSLRACS